MNENTEAWIDAPVDEVLVPADQEAFQDVPGTFLVDQESAESISESTEKIILDNTETVEVLKRIEGLLLEMNETSQDELPEATEETLILDQKPIDYTEQLRGIHVVLLLILLLLLFWWLYDRISNGIRNLNKWTK